jgi:hypothetical protein
MYCSSESEAVAPLNLYKSLYIEPLVKSKATLIDELQSVSSALLQTPSCQSASAALGWLHSNKLALLNQFGLCAWTYAVCQQQPPLPWGKCVMLTANALQQVLQPKNNLLNERVSMFAQGQPYPTDAACAQAAGSSHEWAVALDAWKKFHLAIMSGCGAKEPNGALGARYVIRQMPGGSPYLGRTVCVPTLTPAKLTERSYPSQAECELALSQLPPQVGAVPVLNQVYCNEFGCYTNVNWGRAPAYGAEPATTGMCAGSPCNSDGLAQPLPYQGQQSIQQYQFYY